MTYQLDTKQIPVFEKHYKKAGLLSDDLLILSDRNQVTIGFWQRIKAKRAIAHYLKCLKIIPNHWQTKFFLAKIYQALKDKQKSYQYFTEVLVLEKNSVDVYRELSIAAMDVGEIESALNYSLAALNLRPNDSGLVCNHAINLLVSGNDEEAVQLAERALAIDPVNQINKNAFKLIMSVKNGERKRPLFNEV